MKAGIRRLRRCAALVSKAATQKLSVVRLGSAPVPETCQLPSVKALYERLGLSENTGFFVEVGAYDGETFSNTSFLADQGWNGLYIEPISEFALYIKCRHCMNKVSVDNSAIGERSGSSWISVMGPLSTTSRDTADAYSQIQWAKGLQKDARTLEVKMKPLQDSLAAAHVPEEFELLVVDVEGAEETVITQLSESNYRPRVVVVELHDSHPDFVNAGTLVASHSKARIRMVSMGYSEAYSDAINTVFVRR